MAYPVERLIANLDGAAEEKAELLLLLKQEGLDDAIDMAFVDEKMAREILGGSYPRLSPMLSSATRIARPMMDGWAVLGVGGGGGGTRAGNEKDENIPKNEPGPPPGRVPHVIDVGGPSGAPEETRRTIPGVDRSSRLLRSFTLGTLKKRANKKGGPPPDSLAAARDKKLRAAKLKTHKVVCTFFPTCRRLRALCRSVGAGMGVEDFENEGDDEEEKMVRAALKMITDMEATTKK